MDKFNDSDGWRWYDNKVSVTTIIKNTIANPSLNNWFKKNSLNKITKTTEQAATFGTEAHELFEKIMNGEIVDPSVEYRPVVNSFVKWAEAHCVQKIHTELNLVSNKMGFAGTCDFIGYVDGKLVIADWKTSRTYSITNGYQLGAYRLAAIEMGLVDETCGLMGIQISRINGEIKAFEYEHIEFVENAFLNTLDLFKAVYFNKLKKSEWPWLLDKTMIRNGDL